MNIAQSVTEVLKGLLILCLLGVSNLVDPPSHTLSMLILTKENFFKGLSTHSGLTVCCRVLSGPPVSVSLLNFVPHSIHDFTFLKQFLKFFMRHILHREAQDVQT